MALSIEIELSSDDRLIKTLNGMAPTNVYKAVSAASKRAATAARAEGTKRIRAIYTMKAGDLKSRASIKPQPDGSIIEIKGPPEGIKKFSASAKKYGIFATIKKGHGIRIPRSFVMNSRFVARVGRERYPVEGLYGPSVPQMFGNPDVLDAMQERGAEVFENRLAHEIERRLT
jgi:hypothetical protein